MNQRIRIGLVGGGPGSRIGLSHRIAMRIDDRYAILAGVFSRDREKSRAMGRQLHIAPDRVYDHYEEMARAESRRPDGVEAVAVLTRHDTHHAVARAFLSHRIHVICEKPLAIRLVDAKDIERRVLESELVFALTHNYSGYPMVRQAARMVRDGDLGAIRVVQVEHAQGTGARAWEHEGDSHLAWHTDPAITTEASVVFNLGTHAHHLLRFVTGLEVESVAAQMTTHVPGRRVFDNAFANLRLTGGAVGTLWASMVAAGNEHGLRIRVYGEHGSLEWRHEDPHHLVIRPLEGGERLLSPGRAGLSEDAERVTRLGLGHPEGFFESFANLYREVADAVEAYRSGAPFVPSPLGFPTVHDGVAGVRFVEAVAVSQRNDGAWVDPASIE